MCIRDRHRHVAACSVAELLLRNAMAKLASRTGAQHTCDLLLFFAVVVADAAMMMLLVMMMLLEMIIIM